MADHSVSWLNTDPKSLNMMTWDFRTSDLLKTQTNSQLSLSDHSVTSRLTRSAEKLHWNTKRTQYWLSICLTREDVCGTQYLVLHERSSWPSWRSRFLLSGSLLYEDVAGGKKWFVHHHHFHLSHTPRWFASTPPIKMVTEQTTNQSIRWCPKLVRVSPNVSDVQRLGRCVPA